jgi:uncharacterized protein
MIEQIMAFARETHEHNADGHGFDHVFRVYKLADQLLADYPQANRDLVLTAALLHDTYDDKLCDDVIAAKQRVRVFLLTLDFPDLDQVFAIIDHLSFSANLGGQAYPLDLNGQIVQDADRLDAIGALGIVRALQYGFAHNRELYNPEILPQTFTSKAAYHGTKGTTINHFYEKLFQISATLHTKKAQELALSRDQLMHDFVTAVEREYLDVDGI